MGAESDCLQAIAYIAVYRLCHVTVGESNNVKQKSLQTDGMTRVRMVAVRRTSTGPEVKVRAALRRLGAHYRLHAKDLPGTPDIVNRGRKWAIFVHGCFWHRHPGCHRATTPVRNREFWQAKFALNVARDARAVDELTMRGFKVAVIWECETLDAEWLRESLLSWLQSMA